MLFEEAYEKYRRLVYHVAIRLRRIVPSMDVEDLSQEGLMLLMDVWRRKDLSTHEKEQLFRRDLVNHLRKIARDEMNGRVPVASSIDLDSMFAQADCSVLSTIYAREFKREACRLFSGVDRVILDSLLGDHNVHMEQAKGRYSHASGQWLMKLSSELGITRSYLSQRISNIRRRLRETLAA